MDGYRKWIERQRKDADGLGTDIEQETAARVCGRMDTARERMRRGVALLRADPEARFAFRYANRAMLAQMRQQERTRSDGKRDQKKDPREFRWRPFQLAFLLTVIESTIREEDDFRGVLDLIWFPTGGGKTEAYLGLIAFLIVWRRLRYPDLRRRYGGADALYAPSANEAAVRACDSHHLCPGTVAPERSEAPW